MTETLKEARPSEEALRMAYINHPLGASLQDNPGIEAAYAIDVAPLIAERDNWASIAKAHITAWQEVTAERDELRKLLAALQDASATNALNVIREKDKDRDALKARVAELEDACEEWSKIELSARRELNAERERAAGLNVALDGNAEVSAAIIERLEARVAELEKERNHWRANHDEMVKRNSVLRDRPDLPVDRLPALQRLESSLAASRRQVEGLREALEKTRALVSECAVNGFVGIDRLDRLYSNNGAIADALSALDAPQPEARDNLTYNPTPGGVTYYSKIEDVLGNATSETKSLDPRDAITAEAVKLLRTLSPIRDVSIFGDEEPVVLRVGKFGEYTYLPLGEWSIFRAVRAFIEKHDAPKPTNEALAANPLPEELARPVTEEEVERALIIVSGHEPSALRDRQTYTINSPTGDTIRAALTDFLAMRAKEPKR